MPEEFQIGHEETFTVKVIKHANRLPSKVVDVSRWSVFKRHLNSVLI